MNHLPTYDNQGETYDRYTVFVDPINALMLSPDLKVSMFSSATRGKHLGEQIQFDTLPANVQQHIKERLKP